jgi:hypothetical protein
VRDLQGGSTLINVSYTQTVNSRVSNTDKNAENNALKILPTRRTQTEREAAYFSATISTIAMHYRCVRK